MFQHDNMTEYINLHIFIPQAATRFIMEACPDAEVTARKINKHPVKVTIFHDDEGELNEIFQCAQRDLFAKYGWPAQDGIKKAVKNVTK